MVAAVLVTSAAAVPLATAAVQRGQWKVTPLAGHTVTAATAPSARMARTDPSLLGRTSTEPVSSW
jgi:hypothetical protein